MKHINRHFIDNLQLGQRIFHYSGKTSFEDSPPAEQTLYRVIDLPTADDVVVMRAFDEKEEKQLISRADLLSGDWWYPED